MFAQHISLIIGGLSNELQKDNGSIKGINIDTSKV